MSITSETRRESYKAVLLTLNERQRNVLNILTDCGSMTAQEVAFELQLREITPSDERNFAAPRLTELSDAGLVRAVGKKPCYKSGRRVTVWAIVSAEEDY